MPCLTCLENSQRNDFMMCESCRSYLLVSRQGVLPAERLVVIAELAANLLSGSVVYRVLVPREVVWPRKHRVARLAGRRVDARTARRALEKRFCGRIAAHRGRVSVRLSAVLRHLARR